MVESDVQRQCEIFPLPPVMLNMREEGFIMQSNQSRGKNKRPTYYLFDRLYFYWRISFDRDGMFRRDNKEERRKFQHLGHCQGPRELFC